MDVVYLAGKRQCAIIDKPLPKIKGNFVLIKIHVAPMCNEHLAYKDFDSRDRNRRDSLGHEAAGEVVETAGFSRFKVGDRVVALTSYSCGKCDICAEGAYTHCQSKIDPLEVCGSESGDCGFAQYMIKEDKFLLPIPDGMSYEHASMAVCGLGATFTAMEVMNVKPYDTVLITGLGALGLGGVINARFRNARVIGAARNAYRSRLAEKLGTERVISPENPLAREEILDLTEGKGVDHAIDCSAQPIYQRFALDATRRRGHVLFMGESGELMFNVDQDIIQKGIMIHGSLDLYLKHAPNFMRMIPRIGDKIDQFITHRFPLRNIQEAWELQLRGECGKIILYPWK